SCRAPEWPLTTRSRTSDTERAELRSDARMPTPTDAADVLSDDERRALRESCDRTLRGHGRRTAAEMIAEITSLPPATLSADEYGQGGAVAVLEGEVRELLDKPAAVFMPSGTMAQQIALRIHADRTGRRVVAFHPTCHLELHEDKAYQRLHGLVGRPLGDGRELLTLADLKAVREPLAALLIELPQREIGGRLPAWDELVAQVGYARSAGAAVHLDGARLWESGPFYDRPLSEVAGLFDSVYVSFYKGLGGLAGSMLLGDEDVITEARAWRSRHGGTLHDLWPYAAAGLAGLRLRLPRMEAYVAHAQAIAGALSSADGVAVVPDPPQTPMMHLHLRTDAAAVTAGIRRLASEQRLWTWGGSSATDAPGTRRVELDVGDATLLLTPDDVASAVRALLPDEINVVFQP
ncbi:MAG: beta-eliminating lyase-related protein, partial [Candidatus Limnocylindrales bacterium]